MAQNLFQNDPAQMAENRSTAKDFAWDAALNSMSRQPSNAQQAQGAQQKALDFNAWTPPQAPAIPIIQPPMAAPEPEPAPEGPSMEDLFSQFGLNPDGTLKPPTNQWGDSAYFSNEVPQGKPSAGLGDMVRSSGIGQGVLGGAALLAGAPVAPFAALGAIGGALSGGGAFGSGKGESQRQRDAWRREMQNLGFIDENYQIRLPNGTYFDMGKDGGARLQNGLRYYETDTSNPVTEHVVEMMRPMATILTGGDEKLSADITAYLTNAVMQNGGTYEGARQAAVAFYQSLGVNKVETVIDELQQLRASGAITEEQFQQLNTSAQSLGEKNRQAAIDKINASIQQAQQVQAQQAQQAQAQTQQAENASEPKDYLIKAMQMRQAQSPSGENRGTTSGPSGMQLVNVLQALRARQQAQSEQGTQQRQGQPVQTYSNPRLK